MVVVQVPTNIVDGLEFHLNVLEVDGATGGTMIIIHFQMILLAVIFTYTNRMVLKVLIVQQCLQPKLHILIHQLFNMIPQPPLKISSLESMFFLMKYQLQDVLSYSVP